MAQHILAASARPTADSDQLHDVYRALEQLGFAVGHQTTRILALGESRAGHEEHELLALLLEQCAHQIQRISGLA